MFTKAFTNVFLQLSCKSFGGEEIRLMYDLFFTSHLEVRVHKSS